MRFIIIIIIIIIVVVVVESYGLDLSARYETTN